MAAMVLWFLLIKTFLINISISCTPTLYSLDAIETCDNLDDSTVTKLVDIYSNITIGQTIDFCDLSALITFASFRISLGGEVFLEKAPSDRAALVSNHLYSFYLYDYDKWKAAQCDQNIYDLSCSIEPLSELGPLSFKLTSHGLDSIPYISVFFPYPGLTISTSNHSSLIWLFYVHDGFNTAHDAIAKFITCDISNSNQGNAQYQIYPDQYNIDDNNTAVIYTLAEECSTTDDSLFTELLPDDCNGKLTGDRFMSNGQSYSQYFALNTATTERFLGMRLYFDIAPGPDLDISSCEWTANLTVFTSDDTPFATTSATISDLSQGSRTAIDFIFGDFVEVDNSEIFSYFYFKITILSGISTSGGAPGGGPSGGCIPSIILCYEQSNMKTWRNSDVCIDYLGGDDSNKRFFGVDIPFVLITSLSSQSTSTTAATQADDTSTTEQLVFDTSALEIINSESAETATSVLEFEESTALSVAIAILCGVGVIFLISSIIMSRYTKSDNVHYLAIVVFVVHSVDVFSDAFFCVSIWTDHALVKEAEDREAFMVLAICCAVFIIVPMFKNFYDLIQFQRETQDDPLHGDRYRAWLNTFGTTLLMFALISGSTFGTMKLMNSNLFGLRMFSMGLCIFHLREYHSHRMVNVVLMENIPQVIIQLAFTSILKKEESVPAISILAAVTSILSIIVAVVDHFSKKELTKQAVPAELFTFQITSNEISSRASAYRNRQKKVIKGISKILAPLDKSAIEILTCSEYSDEMGDGLIVYFLITTMKYEGCEMHKKLKDAITNGAMQRNMIKAWDLNPRDVPTINHLRLLQIEEVDEINENIEGNATETTTDAKLETKNNSNPQLMQNLGSNGTKKKLVVKVSDSMQFMDLTVANDEDDDDDGVAVAISPMAKIKENGSTPSDKDGVVVADVAPVKEIDANESDKDTDNKNDDEEGDEGDVEIEMQNMLK